jgi:FeS assembly SUF system protein
MTHSIENEKLEEKIVEIIKTCYDPEIPVDIYELGLIYDISINEKKIAHIKMTLTSPACPVAGTLPGEVEERVQSVEGLDGVKVEIVWDPPWTPEMMTEEARLELGLM